MNRNNSFLLLMAALLLASGAAWLAAKWVFKLETPLTQEEAKTASVVVATLKIPYGNAVSINAVKIQQIPDNLMSEEYFSVLEETEGLITNGDIFPGEILNRQRVTDKALGAILASLIGSDMRAVTVRVNDVIGVAGFLLPNNRVDILSSTTRDDGGIAIDTVLQNIKVLAVDQTAQTKNQESSAVVVRAVTLEVTPEQAETLYKAIVVGTIQLALRNPKDGYIIPPPPEPVVVQAEPPKLVEPKPPEPPKPRVTPQRQSHSVTVIRGISSTVKKFNN